MNSAHLGRFDVAINLRGGTQYMPPQGWTHKRRARDHYELYALHTGSMRIDCSGRSCHLTGGTAVIIPPGEQFLESQGNEAGATVAIIIGFDVVSSQGRDPLSLLGLPVAVRWRRPGLQRQLALRCVQLAPYSEPGKQHDRIEGTGLAQALIMAYLAAGTARASFAGGNRELPGWLAALLHDMDQGYGSWTYSVSDMAAAAGLSTSRFAHVFKEHLGIPPKLWQRRRALTRASQLLRQHPEWTIARIAKACGWRDPNEFTRRYKAAFGHPPRDTQQKNPGAAADKT